MARKLALILLLVVVLTGLALLYTANLNSLAFTPPALNTAKPSGRPLPAPWSQPMLPPVRLLNDPGDAQGATCPAVYRVQKGDTAASIASRCGITVIGLLASNPGVTDPDLIYLGQELMIDPEGAAADTESRTLQSASPGAAIYIQAEGFPSGAAVRVGVGVSGMGYREAGQGKADEAGVVALRITIPPDAQPGDDAFVLVTTQDMPYLQAVSASIKISP